MAHDGSKYEGWRGIVQVKAPPPSAPMPSAGYYSCGAVMHKVPAVKMPPPMPFSPPGSPATTSSTRSPVPSSQNAAAGSDHLWPHASPGALPGPPWQQPKACGFWPRPYSAPGPPLAPRPAPCPPPPAPSMQQPFAPGPLYQQPSACVTAAQSPAHGPPPAPGTPPPPPTPEPSMQQPFAPGPLYEQPSACVTAEQSPAPGPPPAPGTPPPPPTPEQPFAPGPPMQQPSKRGVTADVKVTFPEQFPAPGVTADVRLFYPDDYLVGYADGRRTQFRQVARIMELELRRFAWNLRNNTFIAGDICDPAANQEYREGHFNGLASAQDGAMNMLLWELECLQKRCDMWLI